MRRSEPAYRIPFNRPCFQGKELVYIGEAIGGGQISGNGRFTERCQAQLSSGLDGAKVILTTSCTDALEMAAILLDLGPGDEVIMPTFTFVSTANAFALRGARPVFVDIRRDTLNIDEKQVARADTVRAALALVSRGEAPFGIVYRTDAIADKGVRIVDTFPADTHTPIVYPIAIVASSKSPAGPPLLDYLRSGAARASWEKYGFGLVAQ